MYNKLPELEQQYSAMAKALDATRHEMAVRGVLPVDEGRAAPQELTTSSLFTYYKTKKQYIHLKFLYIGPNQHVSL